VQGQLPAAAIPSGGGAVFNLLNREREILDLVAQGYNNSEIAQRLGISPRTVSNNRSNALVKVQAVDRAKLMLMALEAGFGRPSKA